MEIATRLVGDIAVVDLKGEIDIYNAGQLKAKLLEFVALKQFRVIVNMKRVSYIDSTGIGVLLTALNSFKENSGDLKLAHAADSIEKVFRLTNLMTFFQLLESEEAAISAFGNN